MTQKTHKVNVLLKMNSKKQTWLVIRMALMPHVESNLNSSNTNGSFTTANLNSFLSPCEIFSIVEEIKYFKKFSYFYMKFMLCVLIIPPTYEVCGGM